MVNTFHLHNCGNSRDICEFTFLFNRSPRAWTLVKTLYFKWLQPIAKRDCGISDACSVLVQRYQKAISGESNP